MNLYQYEYQPLNLAELNRVAKLTDFDLFSALRLFSEAGLSVAKMEVDRAATKLAGGNVYRLKTADWVLALFFALRVRAGEIERDEVERSTCCHIDHSIDATNPAPNPETETI